MYYLILSLHLLRVITQFIFINRFGKSGMRLTTFGRYGERGEGKKINENYNHDFRAAL